MSRDTILLVYPHHTYYTLEYPWLPTASIFLASTLLDAGYKVIIVDDRFSRQETLEEISKHIDDTFLVGFTTVCGSQLKNTVEIIRWLRQDHDVPIVLGGSFPSAEPEICLRDLPIDYVITGPGEYGILKLANFLKGDGSKERIPNLYWKDGEGNITRSPEPFVRFNINELPPLPYFNKDVISVERYIHPENRVINYNASTGCVGSCSFCYWHPSYKVGFFDNDRVLQDLKEFKRRYNIKNVEFHDPTFFLNTRRTRDFATKMIDEGLKVKWRANARVDTLATHTLEDFELMKKSGCYYIYLGVESGSPDVLKMMHKEFNFQDAVKVVRLAKQTDLTTLIFLMFGMPGETLENLKETVAFARTLLDINPDLEFAYSFFTPFPGCEMSEAANKYFNPPSTVEEFSRFERVSSSLPENDREPIKIKSPWEEDFVIPWFTDDFYKEYMDYWRKNMPQKLSMTSVDSEKKDYYKHKE